MIETPAAPSPLDEIKTLNTLENIGSSPLLIIRTVFPFRIFPCVIQLDREKLTISNSIFFFTREVENLMIKDLVSISTTENLFFANVTIVSGLRLNKKFNNSFFWNHEAQKLRRLCEGLRIALREGVDVMAIPNHELIARIEEIGSSAI